jgi:hypothetical protein
MGGFEGRSPACCVSGNEYIFGMYAKTINDRNLTLRVQLEEAPCSRLRLPLQEHPTAKSARVNFHRKAITTEYTSPESAIMTSSLGLSPDPLGTFSAEGFKLVPDASISYKREPTNRMDNIHATEDLSKHNVLAVKPARHYCRDELGIDMSIQCTTTRAHTYKLGP